MVSGENINSIPPELRAVVVISKAMDLLIKELSEKVPELEPTVISAIFAIELSKYLELEKQRAVINSTLRYRG